MTPSTVFERFIAPVSAAGLAIFGALSAFNAPPVRLSQLPQDGADASRVYQWMTVLVVGAVWLAYLRRPEVLRRLLGAKFIAAAVLCSAALVVTDFVLTEHWTVTYAQGQDFRIVKGTTLTGDARGYESTSGCSESDVVCLLVGFQGNARRTWSEPVLTRRYWIILSVRAATYLASLAALIAIGYALALSPRAADADEPS